ncbi:hypothetical protein B9Z55_024605 [Caenorhabditis nigoni]|uniref:Uncharacterized protein n=1 Tax=Caenorhabditis nigoni TaxID=1611254 RepID=A0A2G5SV75_9PELO|nr:hypothetical protein B9Z55_024605 [Caenorhabditis nigoni]
MTAEDAPVLKLTYLIFHLAQKLPGIRSTEKAVPLQISKLSFSGSRFTTNDTEYRLGLKKFQLTAGDILVQKGSPAPRNIGTRRETLEKTQERIEGSGKRELTKTSPDGTVYIERVKYDKSFNEARRYLITTFLGNRLLAPKIEGVALLADMYDDQTAMRRYEEILVKNSRYQFENLKKQTLEIVKTTQDIRDIASDNTNTNDFDQATTFQLL